MFPIRTRKTQDDYRGDGKSVGDLPFWREGSNVICSVWEPDARERELIARGANIELRITGEPIPPVMLSVYYEEGDLDANVSSLRSGNDRPESEGQGREGGGGSERVEALGPGPVEGGRLVDGPPDSGSGEPDVGGRKSGDAREDLPGAEVAITDLVQIIDGEGNGMAGEVIDVTANAFGRIYVTIKTENDRQLTILQEKIAKL